MSEAEPKKIIFESSNFSVSRFSTLSVDLKSRLIADILRWTKQNQEYYSANGITINDLPIGTVLPSGNTVIEDENGNKVIRSQIPDYLKIISKNN